MVNILGFFIDRMQGNDVVGYLTEAPGLDDRRRDDRSAVVVPGQIQLLVR